jgi:DNA repair exonuclease SbcCD nuclease subunit
MKKVDAILMSDLHLRSTAPKCREQEEFINAQEKKVKFIRKLRKQHNCVVIDAGDVFDNPYSSIPLTIWAMKNLPRKMYSIPGNHDLPDHNTQQLDRCSFGILNLAKRVTYTTGMVHEEKNFTIEQVPYGAIPQIQNPKGGKPKVLVLHTLVILEKEEKSCPFDFITPTMLFDIYPKYDLILTGHNHNSFVADSLMDWTVVNPGCITRQSVSEKDYIPSIYLWNAQNNEVERVELPHKKNVVSRTHLDLEEETQQRMDEMARLVCTRGWGSSDGFHSEQKLEFFLTENLVKKEILEIIKEGLEYERWKQAGENLSGKIATNRAKNS